jgi:F-type H+-transporting ATPase subunit b
MISFEWQQILTHAVGFLITVWLLKKFAWGPLMNMMDERRNKIVSEFDQIEAEKQSVAKLQSDYEQKLKEIDAERRAKLVEAVNEGKKIAEDIRVTAQRDAKEFMNKAKLELERDVDKAKVQLKEDMIAMTMSAAEKILQEQLDEAKHREMISRFIDEVEKV